MPTHIRMMFLPEEIRQAELTKPFSFTKGMPLLKMPAGTHMGDTSSFGTLLFDLQEYPDQNTQIHDEAIEARMKGYIKEFMDAGEAPEELYERMGL